MSEHKGIIEKTIKIMRIDSLKNKSHLITVFVIFDKHYKEPFCKNLLKVIRSKENKLILI